MWRAGASAKSGPIAGSVGTIANKPLLPTISEGRPFREAARFIGCPHTQVQSHGLAHRQLPPSGRAERLSRRRHQSAKIEAEQRL